MYAFDTKQHFLTNQKGQPPQAEQKAEPKKFRSSSAAFRTESAFDTPLSYTHCELCPRKCNVDRNLVRGFCGAGTVPKLARAALHQWEEPCISGEQGSGTVFFSHCTMRCVFCQNHDISEEGFGKEVSVRQLSDIFLSLEQQGASNINLVTPTHYLPSVIDALDLVRHKLSIPIVYNCGGYERAETIRLLEGYVDVYLPDLKYYDDGLSARYSSAPHYFETALSAIGEMLRQCGVEGISADAEIGLLKRGVIIRHMILPGHKDDSIALLRALHEAFPAHDYLISLLGQYTPFHRVREGEFPKLNRRLTSYEYQKVLDAALSLGFDGYMQEKSSAKEEYTPAFDLEGVPTESIVIDCEDACVLRLTGKTGKLGRREIRKPENRTRIYTKRNRIKITKNSRNGCFLS